jgi:hypothetical protein
MSSPDATPAAPTTEDALQLLRHDHQRIRNLFGDLALLDGGESQPPASADRQGALARLAARLRAHETVEEEIFRPALQGTTDPAVLERDAADHAAIDQAISACAAADPRSEHFGHCVAALAELFNSHVQAEEHDLFRAATAAGLDLVELGTRMATRLDALTADTGAD